MPMRFQDLDRFTAEDIEAAVARNDPDELPLVPVTIALLAPDPSLAADACILLARHEDPAVRGNAIMSLGHLARRFRQLDEARVKPLIEAALVDQDAQVRMLARSAADEIHQFLFWPFEGRTDG